MTVPQGAHSAAKAVKAVKWLVLKKKAVKAVKLHIFSIILLQTLRYYLVPAYIHFFQHIFKNVFT